MSLFDAAFNQQKEEIMHELETRLWGKLEPKMIQELHARHMAISDVAKYLHVSEPTVRRLIREKVFPFFRVRNQIFIRQIDIDQWIEKQIRGEQHVE